MVVELTVPIDAASIAEALEVGRKRGTEVRVLLEPGFSEPPEAWPLELAASAELQSLEVIGPEDRGASIRDVTLTTEEFIGSTITLRNVVVRGELTLNGSGCTLDNCEARFGIEIGHLGACAVRGCDVRSRRLGIAVRGGATIEGSTITSCPIGICIYGNPEVVLERNVLRSCSAAAVVMHPVLIPEVGECTTLATLVKDPNTIEDCGRSFEVHVDVPGVQALDFYDEWPLKAAQHTIQNSRFGSVVVKVDDAGTGLHVVAVELAAPRPEKERKRRRREAAEEPASAKTAERKKAKKGNAAEPGGWARVVLGLEEEDVIDLTEKKLSAAYRRKAREVHPDKQLCKTKQLEVERFHEVTAAYEALLPTIGSAAGVPRPRMTGTRSRKKG